MGVFYVFLLGMILFSAVGIIPADAEKNRDIGIDTSKKCKLMIENNLDTTCPTVEQILALFPDTSPKEQMGGFKIIDGMLQREPTKYGIESYSKYMRGLPEKDRMWINPPGEVRPYLTMITIESNFVDYPIPQSYSMSNGTLSMGTKRYVNFGCTEIILNAKDWIFLTGDSIILAQNNCDPNFTNFDHIKKFYFEKSFQDITTSYKYKLDKWIAESKVRCLTICKEY